ncbi:MAG: tRNA lysidine(34) synthetase TilS [Acidobacteriota bacterium]
MDVYASFLETSRRHQPFDRSSRILAAVSGGSDSTALLYLLHRLLMHRSSSQRSPTTTAAGNLAPAGLAVGHLDHGMRGAASRREARHVAAMTRELGLDFISGRLRQEDGESNSEASLRRRRMEFLQTAAGQWGATCIALGHTLDDQAETFLLRLLRGSGAKGLGGMRIIRSGQGVPVVRPLLRIRRQALRAWLTGQGIGWLEDPSNGDPRYLRNRVRHQLLPLLEELRPGATATTARAARLLQDDEDLLQDQTIQYEPLMHRRQTGLQMDGRRLASLPRPLSRRLLRRAGAILLDSPFWSPAAQHVEEILHGLQEGRTKGRFHLGPGLTARLDGPDLLIFRESAQPGHLSAPAAVEPVPLAIPGQASFPPGGVRLACRRRRRRPLDPPAGPDRVYLDETRVSRCFSLRRPREGDRFQPVQGRGTRLVSAFLADSRIPPEERDRVPLLCCGDEIAWVVGLSADARYAAADQADAVIEVIRLPE